MASSTNNPYKYADKVIATLRKQINALFQNTVNRIRFDELNVIGAKKICVQLYQKLEALNEMAFEAVARNAYEEALDEAENMRFVSDEVDDGATQTIMTIVTAYSHPVTGYVYDNEIDRKRGRAFEGMLAAQSRQTLRDGMVRAARLWFGMSSQYIDFMVDTARLEAFRDAGVKRVRWVTQKDERVCATCRERDEQIYDIDDVPVKHYRCRCFLVPVKVD